MLGWSSLLSVHPGSGSILGQHNFAESFEFSYPQRGLKMNNKLLRLSSPQLDGSHEAALNGSSTLTVLSNVCDKLLNCSLKQADLFIFVEAWKHDEQGIRGSDLGLYS